jgi:hypothetical protein
MRNIFIILLWLLQSCVTTKEYQSRPIGTDSIPQGQLGTALPSAPFHTELKTCKPWLILLYMSAVT